MRTKTLIQMQTDHNDKIDLFSNRCKNDHLNYSKYLPVKKYQSTYTKEYPNVQLQQLIQNKRIEEYRQKIAPPSLDANLLKRSLQRSDSHFSPKCPQKLPSIISGSNYRDSFNIMQNESIVKGKEQPSFFLKMNWHDNPISNYQKSYQQSNRSASPREKGKAVQDHLVVLKKQFKGQSIYNQSYCLLKPKQKKFDSKDCIKNKDHLNGKGYSLHGKSEYKRKYIEQKQVQSTMKSIPSVKKINQKKLSLLPEIKKGRYEKQNVNQKAPKKKGVKNKKKSTKSNPIVEQNIKESTHQRIFSEISSN